MKKRKIGTKLFGVIMAVLMVLSIAVIAACNGTEPGGGGGNAI